MNETSGRNALRDYLEGRLLDALKTAGVDDASASKVVSWCRIARTRAPVAMVGAGFSRNARPVSQWRELAPERHDPPAAGQWKDLQKEWAAGLHGTSEENADPLWLAELYEQQHSHQALLQTLRYAIPEALLELGPAHRALTKLPWRAIVTTNYDRLIERAYERGQSPRNIRVVASDHDLVDLDARPGAVEILHPHGVFCHEGGLVVTLEDYRRFPAQRPLLLTKVRQLFIEHPLLVLGFSATDPNFIQWEGWLGDLLGRDQLPGLCLEVGQASSVPRRTYWGTRLQFVQLRVEVLEDVLLAVAEYLDRDRPTAKDIEAALHREIDGATTVEVVIVAFQRALRVLWQRGLLDEHRSGDELLRLAVKRAFELAHPAPGAAERAFSSVFAESRELYVLRRPEASAAERAEHPSGTEQIASLRLAFGPQWWAWLRAAAEFLGPGFSVPGGFGRLFVNVQAELANGGDGVPTPLREALELEVTLARIEKANDAPSVDSATDQWLKGRSLGDLPREMRASMEDARERARLRLGTVTGNRTSEHPAEIATAQECRRAGYLRFLKGDLVESARIYARAAQRSRDEGEPDHVERHTLETAKRVDWSARSHARGVASPFSPDLGARLDELATRRNREYDRFEALESDLSAKHIRKLQDRSVRETEWHNGRSHSVGGAAERMIALCESFWVRPDLAGAASEARALELMDEDRLPEAARRLAMYGSPELARIVETEVRNPTRVGSLPRALTAPLLEPGRWPGEWSSRLDALSKAVPELVVSQAGCVQGWLRSCAEALLDSDRSIVHGRSFRGYSGETPGRIAEVLRDRWLWADGGTFRRELAEWQESLPRTPIYETLRSAVAARLGGLPWAIWLEEGSVRPEEKDAILAEALGQVRERPPWGPGARERLLDDLLGELCAAQEDQGGAPSLAQYPRIAAELRTWEATPKAVPEYRPWLSLQLTLALAAASEQPEEALQEALQKALDHLRPDARTREPFGAFHALALNVGSLPAEKLEGALAAGQAHLERLASHSDEADNPDGTDIAQAIAHLAARALADDHGDLAERCHSLVLAASEIEPTTLRWAAAVSPAGIAPIRERVEARVSAMLAGAVPPRTYSPRGRFRTRACDIAAAWADAPHPKPLPTAWLHGLALLTAADDATVVWHALNALGILARRRVIAGRPAPERRMVAHAVRRAAQDGRATVRGAAAFALEMLALRMPEGAPEAVDVNAARETIGTDDRVCVVVERERAERLAARLSAEEGSPGTTISCDSTPE